MNLVNLAMLIIREVDQLDSVMEKIGKMIADPYRSFDNCEDVLALMSDERFGNFLFLPCCISLLFRFSMVSATPPGSPGSTLGSRTASLRSVRLSFKTMESFGSHNKIFATGKK